MLVTDPTAELAEAYSVDRASADDTLVRAGAIVTRGVTRAPTPDPSAAVAVQVGGRPEASRRGCAEAELGGAPVTIALAEGRSISVTPESPASLSLRRFGEVYGAGGARPLPAQPVIVRATPDAASAKPWALTVAGSGTLLVCAVR